MLTTTQTARITGRLLALTALILVSNPIPSGAEESAGKTAFLAHKCNLCHGVETADIEAKTKSEKMAGGDLSRVAAEVEPAWLKAFIVRKETKDGEEHKKDFKGTDEELQAIVDWLGEQAAAAKAAED